MLITLFTYFFLSFSDTGLHFMEDTKNFAKNQAPERQELLNGYADEIQVNIDTYEALSKEASKTVGDVHKSREEITQLLISKNDKREKVLQKVFDARFKIKGELSREEWKEAFE